MDIMGINIGITTITVVIVILVVLLSQFRERKFRLWRSIITMLFMLFVTIVIVNLESPDSSSYPLLLGAGFIGLLLGIAVGHHIKIKIADDGSLLTKGSFLSMGIWIFVILAKFYGQNIFNQWGWNPNFILSAFLVISVTTMISRNIYVYMRYNDKKRNMKFVNA